MATTIITDRKSLPKRRKDPAAVSLGRRGGKARTPAKIEAARRSMARINSLGLNRRPKPVESEK